MAVTCRICGGILKKGERVYCNDCSDLMLSKICRLRESKNKNGLEKCIVCGTHIKSPRSNALTCSHRCYIIYNAFKTRYNSAKKSGKTLNLVNTDKYIVFKNRGYTDKDVEIANKLGMSIQKYLGLKGKRIRLDDDALNARVEGLSYGEYMYKHGKYRGHVVELR